MMALRICNCCFGLASNYNHLLFKPNPLPKFSSSTSVPKACLVDRDGDRDGDLMSKRNFIALSIASVFLNGFFPNLQKPIFADELELQRYTDSKQGFTLLRPSSWIKVEKAGATLLLEEPNNGSNNVGVVVNPVRLSSLAEFGTPQFVADKLIQAERRKESTKDAQVIGCTERSGQGGLQVYEFEYKVDSTRGGMKRIFSAAFVASKKLYLVNITHSDKLESPLSSHTRTMLEQVLHSFDAAPLT